ncbi:hypothetical protein A4X09_0g6450, partial [Tilletia walkeri]
MSRPSTAGASGRPGPGPGYGPGGSSSGGGSNNAAAHFHSQSISHLPHTSTAPLLPGQMADWQCRTNTHQPPFSQHHQRPSLPSFTPPTASHPHSHSPSSTLGRGVPRASPGNSPRDASRPVRMTGRPLMQSPSTPALGAAARKAKGYPTRPVPPTGVGAMHGGHAHTSSFSAAGAVVSGVGMGAAASVAPAPHFISRPGTSPGIYSPTFDPRSTPTAAAGTGTGAGPNGTPARTLISSVARGQPKQPTSPDSAIPIIALPTGAGANGGTPARTLISSVARGQPKQPTSPDSATPIIALPMLDISSQIPSRMGLGGESAKQTPTLPRRVLADSFDMGRGMGQVEVPHSAGTDAGRSYQDHMSSARHVETHHQKSDQRQLSSKEPAALPGSPDSGLETIDSWSHSGNDDSGMALGLHTADPARTHLQADASSRPTPNSTLTVPPQSHNGFSSDDDDGSDNHPDARKQVPRASVAPSLLHPSLSLAAAKALLPAERNDDDDDEDDYHNVTTLAPPPPLPPKADAKKTLGNAAQIPTPPPRGKSKPVSRKPAPAISTEEKAGLEGARAGAVGASTKDEPLLGAEWLMPVSSSSSSLDTRQVKDVASAGDGQRTQEREEREVGGERIEYGYATSPEAVYHAQQRTPTARNSDLPPPAVPAKDHPQQPTLAILNTSIPQLQFQPLVLSPTTNWLDVMTMPLSRSPGSPSASVSVSAHSSSYPLSVLSMKDDDGKYAPHTPEDRQLGVFASQSGPLPPPLPRKRSSSVGMIEQGGLFDRDTIDMLRALALDLQDGEGQMGSHGMQLEEGQQENSRCSSGIASPAVKLVALQMTANDGPTMGPGGRSGPHPSSIPASASEPTSFGNAPKSAATPAISAAQYAPTPAALSTNNEPPTRLMPMSVAEARAKAVMAASRLRQQSEEGQKQVKKAHSSGDLLNLASRQQHAPASANTVKQHTPAASEGKLLEQTSLAARQEIVLAAQRSELHHLRFLVSALAARLAAAEIHLGVDLRHSLGDPRVDELIRRSVMQLHAAGGKAGQEVPASAAAGVTSDGFFEDLAKVTAEPGLVAAPGTGQPVAAGQTREDIGTTNAKVSGHVKNVSISSIRRESPVRSLRTSVSSSVLNSSQQQQQQQQTQEDENGSSDTIGEAWIALRRAKKARELAADATRSRDTTSLHGPQASYSASSVQRSGSNSSSASTSTSQHRRTVSSSSARPPSSIDDAFYYSTSRMGSAMGVHNRVEALLGRSDSTSTSGSAKDQSGSSAWQSRPGSAAEHRVMSPPLGGSIASSTPTAGSTVPSPVVGISHNAAPTGSVTSSSVGTRSAW